MGAEYQAAAVGWPLGEALQRTASRTLLKRINLAALDEKPASEDLDHLEALLWTNIREGRLVATGSIRGAAPTLLGLEEVTNCQVENWGASVLKRQGKRETTVEGVRIHPILRSPDPNSHLWGMGLADTFRKFVLEDPEVGALNALLRDPSALNNGVWPGPSGGLHWPLNITSDALAFAYVDSFFTDTGRPLPTPSLEHREIAAALVDRLSALRDILASGLVTAKGTFSQTGEIVLIDSLQWKRDGIFVHALNGDLCAEQKHTHVPIWTGVSFLDGRVNKARIRPVQTKPKKAKISAHFSSVRESTDALWPDGIPNSLTRGSRDQKIIEWQRANAQTVVSDKTIERYFKEYGSLHRRKTAR
jgi:hypothetical protein